MTDTQWLLDLVEEATNRGHRIRHALARLPSDQGQADALMDLRDLERDYGNVGRLCVEQHEALEELLAYVIALEKKSGGLLYVHGGQTFPEGAEAIGDRARSALARFAELKP